MDVSAHKEAVVRVGKIKSGKILASTVELHIGKKTFYLSEGDSIVIDLRVDVEDGIG